MSIETVRRRAIMRGAVQGVFFRDSLRRAAARRGAWPARRSTGRTGASRRCSKALPEAVSSLLELCRTGPPAARVDRVEVSEEEPAGRQRLSDRLARSGARAGAPRSRPGLSFRLGRRGRGRRRPRLEDQEKRPPGRGRPGRADQVREVVARVERGVLEAPEASWLSCARWRAWRARRARLPRRPGGSCSRVRRRARVAWRRARHRQGHERRETPCRRRSR